MELGLQLLYWFDFLGRLLLPHYELIPSREEILLKRRYNADNVYLSCRIGPSLPNYSEWINKQKYIVLFLRGLFKPSWYYLQHNSLQPQLMAFHLSQTLDNIFPVATDKRSSNMKRFLEFKAKLSFPNRLLKWVYIGNRHIYVHVYTHIYLFVQSHPCMCVNVFCSQTEVNITSIQGNASIQG